MDRLGRPIGKIYKSINPDPGVGVVTALELLAQFTEERTGAEQEEVR